MVEDVDPAAERTAANPFAKAFNEQPPPAAARRTPATQFAVLRALTILVALAGAGYVGVRIAEFWAVKQLLAEPTVRERDEIEIIMLEDELEAAPVGDPLADDGSNEDPLAWDKARRERNVRNVKIATGLVLVLLVVAMVPWLYLASRNAAVICSEPPRVSPRLAAWLFVIPAVNVFAIGPILRGIWRHSAEQRQRGSALVVAFAIATLLGLGASLVGNLAARLSGNLVYAYAAAAVACLVPILGVAVMARIDAMQLATYRRRLARGG